MCQNKPGLDVARIPKLAFWDYEREVFYNLERFLDLANRLCRHRHVTGNFAPPIEVLQELLSVNKYQISVLNELFFLIRDAAFAYTRPEFKHPRCSGTSLFKDDSLTGWRWQKSLLKRRIKQHVRQYELLRDLHKHCLRSQDNEQECRDMLETAKEKMKNSNMHEYEYKQQVELIKMLALRLEKYHARLISDLHDYAMKFRKEKRHRYMVLQEAGPIEFEIRRSIKKKLTEALESINRICPELCTLTYGDVVLISEYLYNITCKTYTFRHPTSLINTPEFRESLPLAHVQPSTVRLGQEDVTYATHNMSGVILEDTQETNEFYLPLKKGDTVRLRIVSGDKTVGFGWTKQSVFSFKRWGFFRLTNVQFLLNSV